ncbi:ABC transporter permease [Aridibaculum aurantiacum]|uniref:ABC transporter permease n=1 Tax=Aridibaculum aurantiacum TaxID=2810307 RepID=UPI001A96DDB5|nr:ABC transporter permease [Aridibaculum aurantiacum]
MFRNYLKLAYRNLVKNKTLSFINIFGLAIGLTSCMLISVYIMHELSYDQYHVNKDRIFQLNTDFMQEGESKIAGNTSGGVGKLMQQEFSEIDKTARLMRLYRDDKTLLQVTEAGSAIKSFYETKGYLADSGFFQILTYDFKEGNPQTALMEPSSIVLSEEIASKIWGNQPALNKVIRVSSSTNGDHDYRVTGVYKQPVNPTHIDARFVLTFRGGNMDNMANNNPSLVNNNMFYTYMLLKPGTDAGKLAAKFPAFINTHMGEELKGMGRQRNYLLTPIADVYLHAGIEENVTPGGSKRSLFILGTIALLTLLIASINFMNLATSQSSKRAAEVGVRKVLGAEKRSLVNQYLGEAVLMSLVAMVIAFLLAQLLKPLFENISGKSLMINFQQHALLFVGFFALAVITGLLAGLYPAFYLSSFKPIKVLKGKFTNSLAAVSLRKGMVVFQFVISIALIVASVVIASQMKYMRSKDLGFQKDQQIIIPLRTATAKAARQSFKSELAGSTHISSIGSSMYYPGIDNVQDWLMYRQGKTAEDSKTVFINLVDDSFLKTLGVQPVAGRLFSPEFTADTLTRFVVNEEAIKEFGFASPEDAIGKWLASDWDGQQMQFTIVGVVKNFHFKDLHEAVQPFAFRMYPTAGFNYMIAHAKSAHIDQSLASLESTWKKLNPNEPFEYSFLDLDFQKNYEKDARQATLINYFTVIAILISCLGLFALAAFSAEQRTKEIGIRKVLGASVSSVVGLLSVDFLKLVFIAVVIASPLAWWAMEKWLQNFAFRTTITWHVFALTTVLAVAIAFITISFQSVKAALANPTKNLRTE